MSDELNQTQAAATETATKPVLAKEERITKLRAEIAKLEKKIYDMEKKIYNIENDIVEVKAKKEVVMPEVGAEVLFNYGRRTATTEPVQKVGKVVAIKPAAAAANGKTLPAQIKVQFGEGFNSEFATIYPAQIVTA